MPRKYKSLWPTLTISARNGAKFSPWACKLVVALSHYIEPPISYDEISAAMSHFYREANQPPHMQELCGQLRNAPPGIYDSQFLGEVEGEMGYWRERAVSVVKDYRKAEQKKQKEEEQKKQEEEEQNKPEKVGNYEGSDSDDELPDLTMSEGSNYSGH
ncbi:hypothetical protein MMC28_002735 [Mycoblastus sanguinarius]|nr:hypothetical protein [Mycoblastus sanguinarius]